MKARPDDCLPGIQAREWRFVWLTALAILVVTSLPYVYGYLAAPPGRVFMGLMQDVPDHGQYLSWWRGFQSSFLIPNLLTPEPNRPLFFNLLWWMLGQISKITGLGYAPVYQLFRWVAGASMLWAVYRLIALLVPQVDRRRAAFLLVALSAGLGWVLVVMKYTVTGGELLFPLDLYVAEGNSFLCVLGYPHFAFAVTMIALTLEYVWRGWRLERVRETVIAGGLAFLLGWMHAYDLIIVYGVFGTFFLLMWWKQRRWPWTFFWGGVALFLLSCWGSIYSFLLTSLDPLWERVLSQFANAGVFTPPPPRLFILFGFPLMLAIAGFAWLVRVRRFTDENLFILGWFAIGFLLLYIPTDFQIHMLSSWQIPMIVLAVTALYEWIGPWAAARWDRLGKRAPVLLAALLLAAVLPTNLYLWAWRFVELSRGDYPYYLYQDEVHGLEAIDAVNQDGDVILSGLQVGQYAPALTGSHAMLAHWANTVDYFGKVDLVREYYTPETPVERREAILKEYGVDYVFYGPQERSLGEQTPEALASMEPLFTSENVTVYRVR